MAGPTKQWPRPPSDHPRDLYLWAQQFTDLLTQRWGPLSEIVEEVTPRNLGAAITGVSDLAAFLRIPEEVGAAISGVGALTGDIEETEQLGVAISGAVALTGNIVLAFDVGAAISGAGVLIGDIEETEELGAAIAGASSLTGGVEQTHELGAAVSGASALSGDVDVFVGTFGTVYTSGDVDGQTAESITIPVPTGNGLDTDLIIVAVVTGNDNVEVNFPAAFTLLVEDNNSYGWIARFRLAYATAADVGSSVNITCGTTNGMAGILFRVESPGAGIEASAPASGINPPSLSPSWGSKNTLWIPVVGWRDTSTDFVTSAPSGYSGFDSYEYLNSGTPQPGIAGAYRTSTASSEDPGAFGAGGTIDTAVSYTIAVEPP